MLKIVTAPSLVLSLKAKEYPVKKGGEAKLDKFLKSMEKALLKADDPKGVGLAAPQVNKPVRIFMAKPTDGADIEIYVNPKIINAYTRQKKEKKDGEYKKLEGCLSLPNIWGEVEREAIVILDWVDQKGNRNSKKFYGFSATIIQHEMDHLDGILFPKRVLEQKGKLFKSHKEKGNDVFDELNV